MDLLQLCNCFQEIFDDLQVYPNTVITDEGKEFYNKHVRSVFDAFGIHHYSIKTKMKASMAERVIRTIKTRIEKYFYHNKTKKWIDIIDHIVKNYNDTPHSSIKIAPSKVTDSNIKTIFRNLYPDLETHTKPKLKIGNIVRLLLDKKTFDKGYAQNWTEDLYRVTDIRQRAGATWYKVSTLEGLPVFGSKYFWELNIVADDSQSLG
jgi:L-rhamnose mutarotase